MGGVFGIVSKDDCTSDLFYGTDYHSHLGTKRGGMAVVNPAGGFTRFIHNIENAQFRSKFDDDVQAMKGRMGIGCISDTEDQPLIINSHLGTFSIVTVGRVNNLDDLIQGIFQRRRTHFSEMSDSQANPTEVIAALLSQAESFVDGIRSVQQSIDGSCSLLILTKEGIYAARDYYGRTPLVIGERNGGYAVSLETCAFPNLGYQFWYELKPGEIVLITPEEIVQQAPPSGCMKICAFLWVYYGYPASSYEGVNVELMRNRNGASIAQNDTVEVDMVAGIPDSGTGHAIGYANASHVQFCRPMVKYTPTWPRSFMPQNQNMRSLVAKMKLIPIPELIDGKRIVFCEDSIVRGTQLRGLLRRIFRHGAREVHMRPACPPLIYGCKYLNFSRSRSELDLAARLAIRNLERLNHVDPLEYAAPYSEKYNAMVEWIRKHLELTTLKYQNVPDLVNAIGLPKERVCTYCWDGEG